MKFAILIIGAYLLGSIPTALIIASSHGKDLRSIGSGNLGATNLSRALGRKWGFFCFCLDALKGLAPMSIAAGLISSPTGIDELFLTLGVAVAAVLGHVFPVYIKFKGGKGVATSFGVALGLWPYYTACALCAVVVWVIVVFLKRYISLASIVASVAFTVALVAAIAFIPAWSFADLWPLLIVAVVIPVMVIVRHRENIKRIMAGTESKVLKGKSKT